MKTKLLTLVALATIATSSLSAQETAAPATESSLSVTVTPAVVSQYMFRGVRLGGAAFQPSFEVASSNWGLGVWASTPLHDKVEGVSDPEIDPYGYYTFTVSENLSIVPGFTWYNYPDADKGAGFYKSTFEPSLALNYTVAGVKLTPKAYYDTVLAGATYEFSALYALPLTQFGTELDFLATVGTYSWKDSIEHSSPRVKNWGDYWQVGVSAPFALTAKSKLVVGFAYASGSNNYYKQAVAPKAENAAAVGQGVVTVSYSYTF